MSDFDASQIKPTDSFYLVCSADGENDTISVSNCDTEIFGTEKEAAKYMRDDYDAVGGKSALFYVTPIKMLTHVPKFVRTDGGTPNV